MPKNRTTKFDWHIYDYRDHRDDSELKLTDDIIGVIEGLESIAETTTGRAPETTATKRAITKATWTIARQRTQIEYLLENVGADVAREFSRRFTHVVRSDG